MNAINISNTPRYQASMPMQRQFVTNADASGDHLFTQLARTGDVALYRREKVADGRIMGYEVIKIKVTKAGTVYAAGAAPTLADTESYPGPASFGRMAWACSTQDRAREVFAQKVKEEADSTVQIPAGVFNIRQFAELNGMSLTKETAGVLSGLLATKRLVFKGVVESVQTFAKA